MSVTTREQGAASPEGGSVSIVLSVNDVEQKVIVEPHESLADVLRDRLGLRGTKIGCNSGECGACTVVLDDVAACSCVTLACTVSGSSITTIEGLERDGKLHGLQEAFIEHGAFQCGFCTSGMIMSAHALLLKTKNPSEDDIRTALQGNICRCTGYAQILEAVRAAAAVE